MEKSLSTIRKAAYTVLAVILFLAAAEAVASIVIKFTSRSKPKLLSYFPSDFLSRNRAFIPNTAFYYPAGSRILVKLNNNALRAPGIKYEKDINENRILMLGNSSVFGWAVQENETFSKVLESLCNAGSKSKRYTVINGGIPGFSSYNSLALLRSVGLLYKPDVIIAYVMNSDEILVESEDKPVLNLILSSSGLISGSRLVTLIREASGRLKNLNLIHRAATSGPKVLKPRVSKEDYRKNLEKICDTADKNGIKLYFAVPVVPSDLITDKKELDLFLYEHTDHEKIVFETKNRRRLVMEMVRNEMAGGQLENNPAENRQAVYIDPAALEAEVARRMNIINVEKQTRMKNLSLYRNIVYFVGDYRKIMAEVAAERGVKVINLPESAKTGLGTVKPAEFFLDEIHPSAEGHKIIAEMFYKKLREDQTIK